MDKQALFLASLLRCTTDTFDADTPILWLLGENFRWKHGKYESGTEGCRLSHQYRTLSSHMEKMQFLSWCAGSEGLDLTGVEVHTGRRYFPTAQLAYIALLMHSCQMHSTHLSTMTFATSLINTSSYSTIRNTTEAGNTAFPRILMCFCAWSCVLRCK